MRNGNDTKKKKLRGKVEKKDGKFRRKKEKETEPCRETNGSETDNGEKGTPATLHPFKFNAPSLLLVINDHCLHPPSSLPFDFIYTIIISVCIV